MKLIHRIAYYLGGFIIGLVLLLFFLSGKRTSCDYGPNARTLKNIRAKELIFSKNALEELHNLNLDTSSISFLLTEGNVLFSESETGLDSCNRYMIEGKPIQQRLKIEVTNCDKKATVVKIYNSQE